jgi:parallel beta-helix repeat protein
MRTNNQSVLLGIIVAAASLTTACAVDFHVATAQDLQNALTLAAANGADNNIWITNGYYIGNFNFNSSAGHNLTIQAEQGVTNTAVALDGGGAGNAISLSSSGNANITVQGLTFLRKGSTALRITTGGGGDVTIQDCLFLSPQGWDGNGLVILSGQNATVLRCTATGGGSNGAGLDISGLTANATVQNCVLSTNVSSSHAGGGGLTVAASGIVQITGNSFLGNNAQPASNWDGGYWWGGGGGVYCSGTTVLLSGNSFVGNSSVSYSWNPIGGSGAAAWCVGGSISVSNNTFTANGYANDTLDLGGGAVTVSGNTFINNDATGAGVSGSPVSIVNNSFIGNSGTGLSGGGQSLTISGNTFTRNTYGGLSVSASANGSGALTLSGNTLTGNTRDGGGGAQCSGDLLTITGNAFTGNTASDQGGGLYLTSFGSAMVAGNTFTGNSCTGGRGQGGAIFANGSGSTLTISGNRITQNTTTQTGGGIFSIASTIEMTDNLIANNSQAAAGSSGGGVWLNPTILLDLINNTITANNSAGNGGGAAFQINGLTENLRVYNNILWSNSASGNGADVWLAGTGQQKLFLFNDVDSMYGVWDIAQNLLDVGPQFFDPVNGDYHLRPTSPCANAGTNGAPSLPLTDLDGNSRTNSAGQVDLGCYEFNTTATHPADADINFVMTSAEFNAYSAAWKSGQAWTNGPNPIGADYVTRAGYLMTNGGTYHNDGSSRPANWKTGP